MKNKEARWGHLPELEDQWLPARETKPVSHICVGGPMITSKIHLSYGRFRLLEALVHHIAATEIAAMHIVDFVHGNCFPQFCRVIAVVAASVFQHCYPTCFWHRTHHLSPFVVTFVLPQWLPAQKNNSRSTKSDTAIMSPLASQNGHRHRKDAVH